MGNQVLTVGEDPKACLVRLQVRRRLLGSLGNSLQLILTNRHKAGKVKVQTKVKLNPRKDQR